MWRFTEVFRILSEFLVISKTWFIYIYIYMYYHILSCIYIYIYYCILINIYIYILYLSMSPIINPTHVVCTFHIWTCLKLRQPRCWKTLMVNPHFPEAVLVILRYANQNWSNLLNCGSIQIYPVQNPKLYSIEIQFVPLNVA